MALLDKKYYGQKDIKFNLTYVGVYMCACVGGQYVHVGLGIIRIDVEVVVM